MRTRRHCSNRGKVLIRLNLTPYSRYWCGVWGVGCREWVVNLCLRRPPGLKTSVLAAKRETRGASSFS